MNVFPHLISVELIWNEQKYKALRRFAQTLTNYEVNNWWLTIETSHLQSIIFIEYLQSFIKKFVTDIETMSFVARYCIIEQDSEV